MITLGIESSCDETGCAIVRNKTEILSNVVASQESLHAEYGGVIPELASRRHIETFPKVLELALKRAETTLEQIDLIAVAKGPGLIGALLVGVNFAKGLAFGLNKPLIGVNHVEAHLHSALLSQNVAFPALGVVLSGGHTALIHIKEIGHYELVGQTQDDAIGEAFDKVASLLGLPYPGGPEIEKLAKLGSPSRYPLKVGQIKKRPYNFSFSGLKTGVLYLVKGQNGHKRGPILIDNEAKKDVAATFQHVAFCDVLAKTKLAAAELGSKSILVGGGVSHNGYLRELFKTVEIPVFWPPPGLSTDNAAMIATLGAELFPNQLADLSQLAPSPRLPVTKVLFNN